MCFRHQTALSYRNCHQHPCLVYLVDANDHLVPTDAANAWSVWMAVTGLVVAASGQATRAAGRATGVPVFD